MKTTALIFMSFLNIGQASYVKEFKQSKYCFQDQTCTNVSLEVESLTDQSLNPYDDSKNLKKSMYAKLDVQDPSKMKKFALVQFIRGCFYGTQWIDGIKKPTYYPLNRDHFGRADVRFNHSKWTIDSVDSDPIYWSSQNDENPIENYIIVHPKKALTIDQTSTIRLKNNPDYAGPLYAMDLPSPIRAQTQVWENNSFEISATNASLEFETCVFAIDDLPKIVESYTQIDRSKQIICLPWSYKYRFTPNTSPLSFYHSFGEFLPHQEMAHECAEN